MTSHARRAAAALVLAALLPACARAGSKVGQGEDVGFCTGWGELMRLDEPDLTDRSAVLRWAEGATRILDRIDVQLKVDDERLPAATRVAIDTAHDAVDDFASNVREASDVEGLRRAQRTFADGSWDGAMATLGLFEEQRCP